MNNKLEEMLHRKYNMLEVIGISDDRQCICQCECGKIKQMDPYNVRSGKSKSCGCLSKKAAHERKTDLKGEQFGELKVIQFAGYKYGRTAWLCECRCKNTCIVTAHDLKTHHTRSCGCLKKQSARIRDIKNQRFNHLVALEMTEERDYKKSVVWKCRCLRCGKTVRLSENDLVHGSYKSCGCLKEKHSEKLHDYLHFYEGTCLEFLERKMRCDNKSGAAGVYKRKEGSYRASITFRKKSYYLGTYGTFAEAKNVRQEAENQLFHKFSESYRKWLEKSQNSEIEEPFLFEVTRSGNQFQVNINC